MIMMDRNNLQIVDLILAWIGENAAVGQRQRQ